MQPLDPARPHRHRRRLWAALGLGSLAWFLYRTGTKPQRVTYPCQQAALANSVGVLAYFVSLLGTVHIHRLLRRRIAWTPAGILVLALLLAVVMAGGQAGVRPSAAAVTDLPSWTSPSAVSNVFAVMGVPAPECSLDGGALPTTPPCNDAAYALSDKGVDSLVAEMEYHGKFLHRTAAYHPQGIIGSSDVVVIKINNQWGVSGGDPIYGHLSTNTDVLKGVIWRILQHPDGFTGEIVIAENTQGVNPRWDNNPANAQDPNQSYEDVVAAFRSLGYPVSLMSWDNLPTVSGGAVGGGYPNGEYARGNNDDAYILLEDPASSATNELSYPKFRTAGGRHVSMRYGVWNARAYDANRLKFVNLPILKAHCMAGATIAWKNYVGFTTIRNYTARFGSYDRMHDFFWNDSSSFNYGLVGREIALIRPPDLNVVDAIWVAHQNNYDSESVRQDVLLASADPFAVDWYASEHVLRPVETEYSDPADTSAARAGIFRSATRMIQTAAKAVWPSGPYPYITLLDSCDGDAPCDDEKNQMNVYVDWALPPSISVDDVSVTEGDSGTVAAQFTVSLSRPARRTVIVQYQTVARIARVGSDFVGTLGYLYFSEGESEKTVTVNIVGDTIGERDEEFLLRLSNPSGGVILDGEGIGTIVNDDPPTLFHGGGTVPEGNLGSNVTWCSQVDLLPASGETVTLDYATEDGTAVAGVDYLGGSGTLTFAPGSEVAFLCFTPLGDDVYELDETFFVNLGNAVNAPLITSRATWTIRNDDVAAIVEVRPTTATVGEAAGPLDLSVVRSENTWVEAVVDYAVTGGTATAGLDYVLDAGTLTFAPGVTTQKIRVRILDDTLDEPQETLVLTVSNRQGTLIVTPVTTFAIQDNDVAGVVKLSAATYRATEGGSSATITVRRTLGIASGVTVDYATSNGTATEGADYTDAHGSLSFGAGQTAATFVVPVLDDDIAENDETVQLTLANPKGNATLGAPRTALLTILENEPVVQLTPSALRVGESGSATVTAKRSGSLAGGLTVDYLTSDGTARAGVDYQARAGTLSFGPNVAARTFTIPIVNDTLDEADETVLLRLRNPQGGLLGPAESGVVTITDNDAGGVVQLGAATYSVAENKGSATITVTRTGGTASGVSVAYAAMAGTAEAPADFTAVSGTLTFAAGQAARSFAVPIVSDTEAEGVETVVLVLADATGGATLGPRAEGVLRIIDDESVVELGAAAFAVVEGGVASLTAKRFGALAGSVTVYYATSDGSAAAGTDYTARTGTLTFGAGVANQVIPVSTTQDTTHEDPKTFAVTLDSPTGGAALGHQSSALVTINDNDSAGAVQFGAASCTVAEGTARATISVTRSGGTASGVTVDYATADGTAVAGDDYTSTTGTLTFAAAQASATFTVSIADGTANDGSRTVLLGLSDAGGGASLGARASAVLTITDNDGPTLQLGAAAYTVAEGRQATITVTRKGSLMDWTTVQYATSDGTAQAGTDYTAQSGTLTVATGQASRGFTIPIVDDTDDEANETLTVTLWGPSGAALGAPTVATVTIVDNDTAGAIQFGAPVFSKVEPEDGTTSLATITVVRTGGVSSGATVQYATSDGSATDGSDYTGVSGMLTFAADQTEASFTVELDGDAVAEGNESIDLTLSAPGAGLTLGVQSTARLWIVEPAGAAKLVFVHHSTGENWLSDTNGQLGLALRDNNYFVSDTNYAWGPAYLEGTGTIGDHTDIGHWWSWFRGPNSATYLDATEEPLGLYHDFNPHSSYTRLAEDPDTGRENEIIVFKSCFPNSNLAGNPDDPATGDPNPLRGQPADAVDGEGHPLLSVGNAKGIYNDILEYFAAHQDRLFVVITAPPLVNAATTAEQAANARAFNDWLVNDWLASYPHNNVAVFDFYNVLTSSGGTPGVNDLGKETGNHHRWWNGAVQHVHAIESDVSAYGTSAGDSHPTAAGGKKATGEFVTLLNFYYNRWKGIPVVAGLRAATEAGARMPAAGIPDPVAPPGRIASPR